MEQNKVDKLMKNQDGHMARQRTDGQCKEREGDAMLRLLRMKLSVKDVGEIRSLVRELSPCMRSG